MNLFSILKTIFASPLRGAVAVLVGGAVITASTDDIYSWTARLQAAQVELLKMDWRGPQIFCTEFSLSYDSKTQSCAGGRKLTHRMTESANRRP